MSGATFVTCPACDRLMLGQRHGSDVLPQPHDCAPEWCTDECPEDCTADHQGEE